ncbi:hypothetical protein J6590_072687 [Homalodisca vitripennis]|nr:hypothetical protein J6590_072687 [Homalodisca vitripennis]
MSGVSDGNLSQVPLRHNVPVIYSSLVLEYQQFQLKSTLFEDHPRAAADVEPVNILYSLNSFPYNSYPYSMLKCH